MKDRMGYKTNQLVPINLNFGSAVLRTDARLSLQQSNTGEVVLAIHGIRKQPELERPYFGHIFSDEDKKNLLETSNMGRVVELNDALISTLNKQSLDIAREIYAEPDPDMEFILEELLGQSEQDLKQYDQILALRQKKRLSISIFDKLDEPFTEEHSLKTCAPCSTCESSAPENDAYIQSKRIISLFKNLIGM